MDAQPRNAGAGAGCSYARRCPQVIAGLCETTPPPVRTFGTRHLILCHLEPAALLAIGAKVTTAAKGAGGAGVGAAQAAAAAAAAAQAATRSLQPPSAAAGAEATPGGNWAARALAVLQSNDGSLAERAGRALALPRDR